jgi:hypothetical protein
MNMQDKPEPDYHHQLLIEYLTVNEDYEAEVKGALVGGSVKMVRYSVTHNNGEAR